MCALHHTGGMNISVQYLRMVSIISRENRRVLSKDYGITLIEEGDEGIFSRYLGTYLQLLRHFLTVIIW